MAKANPEGFLQGLTTNNPTLELVGPFVNTRTPVKLQCSVCKHRWIHKWPPDISSGRVGCPSCSQRLPLTRQRAQKLLDKATKRTARIEADFDSCRSFVPVRCLICNTVTRPRIDTYVYRRVKGMECVHCRVHETSIENRYKAKHVNVHGKTFKLMGYEPQALRYIVEAKLACVEDIITGIRNVPRIQYLLNGKQRFHYADFWIPSQNRLVEVKSRFTFLGTFQMFRMLIAKRNAAIALGYKYSLLVIADNGTHIKLPRNWHEMKFSILKALI